MPVATIKTLFQKPIFRNDTFILSIFFLATLVTAIQNTFFLDVNNYKIFFYSLQNLTEGINLYAEHPDQHYDYFLYAPAFPVFFSPFFLLPFKVGLFMWHFFFAAVWLVAVYKMPLKKNQKVFILWYCFQELVLALGNAQTNPLIAAIPLFAFIAFEKNKPFWAAFFILLGFNIKIYSIVAAALFIVYPQKLKFILSGLFWAVVFAVLPVVFTTPARLLLQYQWWLGRLFQKSDHDRVTNISIHRLIYQTISPDLPTLAIVGAGVSLFCTVYLRWKVFKNVNFRMLLLSSILVFQVIFHPAAESATYITAVTGVTIYWLFSPKNATDLILIIACYIFTVMGSTDLMPRFIKENFIKPYVLKALPCVLIWFRILYLMHVEPRLSTARLQNN